ncbi:MAG TPA: 2Fe-2S iron-sulfur cluster binding domain-containing protein [Chloroflexi bacterium]|nr:2Fe-2S iron-sulfur cluster binding domain-containing protein [Chloroflexota bacterium]
MPDETQTITLTIDGQEIHVPPGTTILEAAEQNGITIPHVCYHEALTPPAVCRVCVVEVEGARVLQAACVAECAPDMVVHTHSERVETSRRTILEMLSSAVTLDEAPELQQLLEEYQADTSRFSGGKRREFELLDDNPFYVRDYSQCIMCWRCVEICADDGQYAFALNFGGRGFQSHIATFRDYPLPDTTCVFCGQCVNVCPTGALKPKIEWGLEQGLGPEEIRQLTRRGKKRKKGNGRE